MSLATVSSTDGSTAPRGANRAVSIGDGETAVSLIVTPTAAIPRYRPDFVPWAGPPNMGTGDSRDGLRYRSIRVGCNGFRLGARPHLKVPLHGTATAR